MRVTIAQLAITPTYDIAGTRIGIQICRELLFREPWLRFRHAGARIVFHLNNAIWKPSGRPNRC